MRLLLFLLCAAACAQAQVLFGPDTLVHGVHCEYTSFCPAYADTFGCLWGPRTALDDPGIGQKILRDGTPVGPRQRYVNRYPHEFDCAAELTIVRLPGGGEVRRIGHS
jgi:hypothetical protein